LTTTVRAETRCVLRTSECWEKLSDLSLAKHYVPGVKEIEFVSQSRTNLGTSRIAHSSAGALQETVIEWNEGSGFLLRLHRGERPPRPMKEATFRYAIEPDGVGTRIVLTMTYAFGLGPLGRLLERLARRPMQRNVERIAERLARFWETGSAEP
jgi:hypothetical protein